jgi:Mg/Co/Ni transporter MgtE
MQPNAWACTHPPSGTATVLGAAIAAAMTAASGFGVILPIFLMKLRIDPILAMGPIAAIGADLLGLVLYLCIAWLYF